ncbi:MAG: sodium:solute symporter, partial [Planctomycetota bacterium]
MNYLNSFDYAVIGVYFCVLVGLGFYLKKKASQSIEDYFIGGRKLPWWALGISGVASWVDITGTMMIVSFLYMLGPRGFFIEFRGGAGLILPFMMLWAGKWMRRSKCITSAEWMIFRFGDGFGGRFAQLAAAIGAVIATIGMLGYLVKGVGLFLSMFLPFEPFTCAFILIGIATVYTMVSGFYGVVFTDIFQSGIILTAVATVATMAIIKVTGHENFTALATQVTGQKNWTSGAMSFHTHMPVGYEVYKDLFMFSMFYLLRNVFAGMGFPGDA